MLESRQLTTALAKQQQLKAAYAICCHCSLSATTAKAPERRSARRVLRSRPCRHVPAAQHVRNYQPICNYVAVPVDGRRHAYRDGYARTRR